MNSQQQIESFSIEITPYLIRKAFRRHFVAQLPWVQVGAVVAVAAMFPLELGQQGTVIGVALLGAAFLFMFFRFVFGELKALKLMQELRANPLQFELDDSGLRSLNEPLFSSIPWRGVIDLLLYDDCWIFYTSRGRRLPIVSSALTDHQRERILKSVTLTRAKVIDRRSLLQ